MKSLKVISALDLMQEYARNERGNALLNIRTKTIVILVLICAGIAGILYATSQMILLNSFARVEQQNTEENVQRALNAFSTEISNLDTLNANGWASWTSTYNFVVNNNTAYIANNLVDENFQQAGINCMLFINFSGQLVYGKAYDLQNDTETPLPSDLLALVASHPFLWNFNSTSSYERGIILLAEGPMIISSRPILTSQGVGPVHGALVMGEYLTQEKTNEISSQVQLPLTLETFNDSALPPDFQLARSSLSSQAPIWTTPLNGTVIAGYSLLDDIFLNPVLIMRADMPRNIYAQGQTTINYFMLSSLLWAVAFVCVTMLLLEKTVLSRLTNLSRKVSSIGKTEPISTRVPTHGNDEITTLAKSINNMLTEIENKTIKLRSTERLAAIGELTTAIAHDLRNPMQGINAATYYLKTKVSSTADEKTAKMLTLIEKDIKHSDRIIRQLLEYSQPIWLQLNDSTPAKIIGKALSLIAVPQNIHIVNSAQDDLKIRVDEQKMSTVFADLFQNAIEAMPQGGTLKIESMNLNDHVTFRLSDTGVGMSQEQLGKVWSPLFTTKAKGMGLSLPTCKRVVEAHKGNISIQSTLGKGATVTITIPPETEPSSHQTV